MPDDYDIAVDFMDMNNERRLWVRAADARSGLDVSIGRHVVVGDEDADPRVAQIVAVAAKDWLSANEPGQVLALSLREDGFLDDAVQSA